MTHIYGMVLGMPRQTKARKKSGAGKRYPLNMRTTKAMRGKLERAAAAAGRSLAQEVEFRLERSFLQNEIMIGGLELAYGRQLAGVLLMLGDGMRGSCQAANTLIQLSKPPDQRVVDFSFPPDWLNMPFVFDQAVQCVDAILEALRPPDKIVLPVKIKPRDDDSDVKQIGKIVASSYADEGLIDLSLNAELERRGYTLRKFLGSAASRLDKLRLEPENKKIPGTS